MNSHSVRPARTAKVSNQFDVLMPEVEVEAEEESEGEAREVKRLPRIRGPTKKMREDHKVEGHAVYRPWCGDCVAGRGRRRVHRAVDREGEEATPVVALDYGFLGLRCTEVEEDDPEILMTLLAMHDQGGNALAGLVVPEKGGAEGYAAAKVASKLEQWGHGPVFLKIR